MMNIKTSFLLLSVFPFLVGCSWNGQISQDFYSPMFANQQLEPITVGIIVNQQNAPRNVQYGVNVDYSLNIKNYIHGLASEFQNHFENVKIISSNKECSECEIFAIPHVSISLNQFSGMGGGRMDVLFVTKNQRKLTRIQAETEGAGVLGTSLGSVSSYGAKN